MWRQSKDTLQSRLWPWGFWRRSSCATRKLGCFERLCQSVTPVTECLNFYLQTCPINWLTNRQSVLAIEVYVQRIKHYLGAYLAELGQIDAVVFTAGVGENSAPIRALVCAGLQSLGIVLNQQLNQEHASGNRSISAASSKSQVLVIPTNEELEIATRVAEFLR